MAAALVDLRARTVFHKVKIRPGKPILFSQLEGGQAFFGLPGNPISTAVGFRFFVGPYLRRLVGRPPEQPLRAVFANRTTQTGRVALFFESASEYLRPEGDGASGPIVGASQAFT